MFIDHVMQGMNEVLGPIYYVFAQHPDPKWKGKILIVFLSIVLILLLLIVLSMQNMLRQIVSSVSLT